MLLLSKMILKGLPGYLHHMDWTLPPSVPIRPSHSLIQFYLHYFSTLRLAGLASSSFLNMPPPPPPPDSNSCLAHMPGVSTLHPSFISCISPDPCSASWAHRDFALIWTSSLSNAYLVNKEVWGKAGWETHSLNSGWLGWGKSSAPLAYYESCCSIRKSVLPGRALPFPFAALSLAPCLTPNTE